MELFTGAGGRVERGRLDSLEDELTAGYDVLVNCTGLGARDLLGDETIEPLRGESWILRMLILTSDGQVKLAE